MTRKKSKLPMRLITGIFIGIFISISVIIFWNSSLAIPIRVEQFEGTNIFIESKPTERVNDLYRDLTFEYFGCFEGMIEANSLILHTFKLSDTFNASESSIVARACHPLDYADIHSHPSGSCKLSEQDKDTSIRTREFYKQEFGEINLRFTCIQCNTNQISCFDIENDFIEVDVGLIS